jgi:hypothetical protein
VEGPLQRSKYQGRAFLIIMAVAHEGEAAPMKTRDAQTTARPRKVSPRKVSIDGKEKSGNTDFTVTDFTVIDKLHSAEPEKLTSPSSSKASGSDETKFARLKSCIG